MSVAIGFFIFLMLLFLGYMAYRLFIRKSIVELLCISLQVFSISLAIMNFTENITAEFYMQIVYLVLGILVPSAFFTFDAARMFKEISKSGTFKGLVEKKERNREKSCDSSVYGFALSPIKEDISASAFDNSLSVNSAEISRGIKQCIRHASELVEKGLSKEAVGLYEVLTYIIKNNSDLYYNIGNACHHAERFEEAIDYYQKAFEILEKQSMKKHKAETQGTRDDSDVKSDKDLEKHDEIKLKRKSQLIGKVLYNLAITQHKLGRYDDAIKSFEALISHEPESATAWESMTAAMVAAGRISEAVSKCEKNLSKDAEGHKGHYLMGRLYYEAKRYPDAVRELEECLRQNPGFTEAYIPLGKVYMRCRKLKDAVDTFKKYTKLEPKDHRGYYNLGTAYYAEGERESAAECFKKVVELDPDNYKGFFNLAVTLDELNRFDEAEEALRMCISIQPTFVDAYNNLGAILSFREKYLDAINVYIEGLKKNPKEYSLYYNLGVALSEAGRYKEAAEAYKNALEIRPEETEIMYHLGAALTQTKKYDEAIAVYKKVMKINSDDSELFYNIATVYGLMKKNDIAMDNLKKALSLDESLKSDAKRNRAFEGIRYTKEFKELVS